MENGKINVGNKYTRENKLLQYMYVETRYVLVRKEHNIVTIYYIMNPLTDINVYKLVEQEPVLPPTTHMYIIQ